LAELEKTDRGARKTRVGTVVSDKMDKTVVVAVQRMTQHSLYKRRIERTTTFKAHDEKNEAHVGDRVKIMETRPVSRDKRWRVVEIVDKAK
jgi:small subunit ribosomal protein S17